MVDLQSLNILKAINNNRNWCQSIAKVHQVRTDSHSDYWRSLDPMPTFFPNLVTLDKRLSISELQKLIPAQGQYFVKDCFAIVDLEALGFTKLFEANWYVANARPSCPSTSGVSLTEATSAQALTEWEALWLGDDVEKAIYPASSLDQDSIRFFTAEHNGKIAGMTSFDDKESLGIYNLWGERTLLASLINHLHGLYPDKDIVGYGDEQETQLLQQFGFNRLHPLTVWGRFT